MPGPQRNRYTTKEKADFKALGKLLKYCKSYVVAILVALFFAMVAAITSIIGPNKINDLMNVIESGIQSIDGISMPDFLKICYFLISIYILGAIVNYCQQFIMADVTQKTSKRLRSDINKKINQLPLSYFDTTTRGDILSRITNDVDTISQTLSSTIANLVNAITLFIGVIIMMFVVNWELALVTIASSIIGFILVFFILTFSQKYFNKRQKNLGDMNGHIEEIYSNPHVVKSYNGESKAIEQFDVINKELYRNNYKSQFLSGLMQPIMNFSGNLSYASIFIVGVFLILNGNSNVGFGTIISFTIYARLFSQPLSTFAQSLTSIQQASAASRRVFEMLEAPNLEDESKKNKKLEEVKGDVEFKNVQFGYHKDNLIIKNFSIELKRGQKVAIVGPTGAGKTTIVNLLMRFYEVTSGDILIDGVSIQEMKREEVHNLFDMILQDTWLFHGSVRENLVYNKENVTNETLEMVCKAEGLQHFIQTLPNVCDTILDNSINISEGQKQQLTIARAMIKDAPLLILDEATSSVDTRTEIVIQNAMDQLTVGRTSFVIAHRLSTIKNADIILVMNKGDIIEQGTHEQLLAKKGFYAELYNSQFEIVS